MLIRQPMNVGWEPAKKWLNPLFDGLGHYVTIEPANIDQPYSGVVVIEILVNGKNYKIAIDYSDYLPINGEAAKYCCVYFKMQYCHEGYGSSHIVPGGFPNNDLSIHTYLSKLRSIQSREEFLYDVYGRFGSAFAKDVRTKALQILLDQQRFEFEGSAKITRYSRFLMEVAQSRICIDLPGNGDFCFRLIDYLAIGACIIGPKRRTTLHVPLIDREHVVYTKDDLSDLVDLCAYYLENEQERKMLCLKSREYFDKYLHRYQLAAYYLYTMQRFFA